MSETVDLDEIERRIRRIDQLTRGVRQADIDRLALLDAPRLVARVRELEEHLIATTNHLQRYLPKGDHACEILRDARAALGEREAQ